MATITKTITGDTASSVTLTSLTRDGTGTPVSVFPALPQPFADAGGGAWRYTFPDPPPGVAVNYSYTVTWPDVTSESLIGKLAAVTPARVQKVLPPVPCAADMVASITIALASTPAGVVMVTIDGQEVSYNRAQAIEELKFWKRQAAHESGRRPRIASMRLDGSC